MAEFLTLEANLRAMLGVFVRAKGCGEGLDLPGLSLACSGVHSAMFNAVLLTSPVSAPSDLHRRIRTAARYFHARELPWSVWLCEDWLNAHTRREAKRILATEGLHLVVDLPGMAADRIRPPGRALPQLEFRRVENPETRYAFNYIISTTFGIALSTCGEIYESEHMWRDPLLGYVGYADGNPVTTAATVTAGGAVGVYAVGTLPAHQRKGYAEAILRYALAEAHRGSGIERTVLESSRAGFDLYVRMGYQTVTGYSVYAFS